ncbi:methyltransferase [Spirillospora sp. NPDC049652]
MLAGILHTTTGFARAQAVCTAVELDLFTVLDTAPATEAELRRGLRLNGRGLGDLLALLVELGLLREDDRRFRNSPAASRHLVAGRPGYVGGALLGAKANLYPLWAGLADTLRTGIPRSADDDFAAMLDDPPALRRYAAMMAGAVRPVLPGLLKAVDWTARTDVLDVGGCRGDLVAHLVRAHPTLRGHVFDLPQLAPVFAEHMAAAGAASTTRFHAGDFFRDPLPGADVVILGHVLHNWPAARREELLRKVYAALPANGVLLVYDRMLDEARSHVENLVASLTMALVTADGAEYTASDLEDMARGVGFTAARRIRLDDNETLVVLTKPAGSDGGAMLERPSTSP